MIWNSEINRNNTIIKIIFLDINATIKILIFDSVLFMQVTIRITPFTPSDAWLGRFKLQQVKCNEPASRLRAY